LNGILRFFAILCVAVGLANCDTPPVNRTTTQPLQTVNQVDLERYTGVWFEIARYENSFERDCVAVTATYSKNSDDSIKVVNRCRHQTLVGEEKISEGRASVVDMQSNARLSVSFFWPFSGDYWVIGLAEDYSWALVGEPTGRYLWILSRTSHLTDETKAHLIAKLIAQGYNTKALHWTLQP
jgi:apolipoprotein D and lipocalin family protein